MGRGPGLVIIGAISGSFILIFFVQMIYPTNPDAIIVHAAEINNQINSSVSNDQEEQKTIPSPANCAVSDRYPQDIRQWCVLITTYAVELNLAPDLVAALIWQESGGNPVAYSKSGAVGLMQVMPRDGLAANFMCINGPCFKNRPTTQELQDPEFNVKYGTRMLAGLLNRHGNMREALKAYGPMNSGYSYADKVLGIYESFKS